MNTPQPRIAVLADDLIWSSRLIAAVERGGGQPLRQASAESLGLLLASEPDVSAVVIDLNGRGYDGVEAVRLAATDGRPVLAVGQHEDLELRKRAMAAGARRVFSYNKLFSDGPQVMSALVEGRL